MSANTSAHSRHLHRKRLARIYLSLISLLVAAADAILMRFSLGTQCPTRLLFGVLLLQSMGTIFLVYAVWKRQAWARYVLIVLLFGVSAVFAMVAMSIGSNIEPADGRTIGELAAAIGLILIATTWLIKSRKIQYLATPPGSGG